MITLKNISKSFDDRIIIQGIDAVMESGKCNLIIGTSGSGKTVLTKCIVGLIKPNEGSIEFDGEDLVTNG
jgi:phospholipid/cholesterol/gamma-HCH transport system ATP-binding protein